MRKKFLLVVCYLFLLFINFLPYRGNAQKTTDTIFFNIGWQICEKPMAAYYRIGTLLIDSNWIYTGKFKDYSMQGILQTEGEYGEDGTRNGNFVFYDTEGKMIATGNYVHGKKSGRWQWVYTNGSPRAVIDFSKGDTDFRFEFYRNNHGEVTLENGNGNFTWNTAAFEDLDGSLTVLGAYENGKRTGTWKYYRGDQPSNDALVCSEIYNVEDGFKKSKSYGYSRRTTHEKCFDWLFVPRTLFTTENMFFDNFFWRGPDTVATTNLKNYLLNRKSVDIVLKQKGFDNAFFNILSNLDSYRGRFDYESKDIDGIIEFKVGDRSMPEDITVTGNNITATEKDFLLYLMGKFRNIEMPGDSSIAYEGYHKIYFYSLNMKEYVPVEIRDDVGRELFFTTIPRDKYLLILKANKRRIKKYIREEFRHYW